MVYHRRSNIKKSTKSLYPVGGYTKRIDQYGAVPASVLAEERRLQKFESHLERSRRWQLAQCERKRREAERRLIELNEAKERAWLLPVVPPHTEYLYGGCLAVRAAAGDTEVSIAGDRPNEDKDVFTSNNKRHYRMRNDGSHHQPSIRECHRTQATTDLPELLINPSLQQKHRRQPRSWASLKKQFQDKILPHGNLPRICDTRTGSPLTVRTGRIDGGDGTRGMKETTGRGQYMGRDFINEMKRCRYLRVPVHYGARGDDDFYGQIE